MRIPVVRFGVRRVTLAAVLCLAAGGTARAQGEGPRTYALTPVGLNAVSVTYMSMSSNYNFAQDILIKGADLDSDVWAISYNRFFSLGGRFAEIWITPVFGTINRARATSPQATRTPPPASAQKTMMRRNVSPARQSVRPCC